MQHGGFTTKAGRRINPTNYRTDPLANHGLNTRHSGAASPSGRRIIVHFHPPGADQTGRAELTAFRSRHRRRSQQGASGPQQPSLDGSLRIAVVVISTSRSTCTLPSWMRTTLRSAPRVPELSSPGTQTRLKLSELPKVASQRLDPPIDAPYLASDQTGFGLPETTSNSTSTRGLIDMPLRCRSRSA
jgi:hypothetical protein